MHGSCGGGRSLETWARSIRFIKTGFFAVLFFIIVLFYFGHDVAELGEVVGVHGVPEGALFKLAKYVGA